MTHGDSAARIYPVHFFHHPQVVKALARNGVTATLLGKEGIIATIASVISGLSGGKYCPKLKVALEALDFLTKTSKSVVCTSNI